MPEPMTTDSVFATAASTSTGHPSGRPTGVIPPYSMPVAVVTSPIEPNDALRAPRCRRTSPFTSARVVASTMHAAYVVPAPRRAAITTQFAECSGATPYRWQNAAVSARSGSISATSTSPAGGHAASAARTAGASSRASPSAGVNISSMRPSLASAITGHSGRRRPENRRGLSTRREGCWWRSCR
jgi:hypothetical protein